MLSERQCFRSVGSVRHQQEADGMASRFLHRATATGANLSMAGLLSKAVTDARNNFQGLPMVQQMEKAFAANQYDHNMLVMSRQTANVFVIYLTTSLLYVTHKYTVPHYFASLGEWAVYYAKVAITFCYVNIMANWLCVKCYQSFVPVTRDRPEREEMVIRMSDDGKDKKQLPWTFCDRCELEIPPRAHHCNVCNRCVLKRDHHCFFLGVCVGYWNQRFFFVLSFWLMLGCTLGKYLVYVYLRDTFFPTTSSYWEMFLPVTIYNCIFAEVSLDHVIMLSLINLLWIGVGMGFSFFSMQTIAVSMGKTSYEAFKNAPVRVKTGFSANMRSVFGPFWLLNFIFPANILFRQSGDGTQWDEVTTC